MSGRWTGARRMSVAVTLTLATAVVGVIASCGDPRPAASGDGSNQPPLGACATPQTGCTCTPGSVVPCGKTVHGDLNFIYCYVGTRTCGPEGIYGECGEGTVVTKSFSSLHVSALGAPGACTGADPGPLRVCTSGKRQGDACTVDLDCSGGKKKCLGGPNDGANCSKSKDCADPGDCVSFNGTCSGGTRSGFGCDVAADCTGGVFVCTPAGGGGTCGTFIGICDNGSQDGEACTGGADCPGGTCEARHGRCQGAKDNGKKCGRNKHCYGSASCSAETDASAGTLDPCDPYCNAYSDTAIGLDAGPSFTVVDGGLVPTGGVLCGDSVVSVPETCDDGNTAAGDGCSAACKIEPGFKCPTPGMPCSPSTCGNGIVEGLEQCDDGPWVADSTGFVKDRPYDGCYNCQREFNCPVGAGPGPTACTAVCGDGIVFPGEACDDGNAANGDGCSSTCTIEPGATCVNVAAPLPTFLDVPVIYRDFDTFGGYLTSPDFQFGGGGLLDSIPHKPGGTGGGCAPGVAQGIPQVSLATTDREPVLLNPLTCILNAASYATWYHDDPNNKVILGKLLRLKTGAPLPLGTYQFDSAADPPYNLPDINCGNAVPTQTCAAYGGFFPINGLGFGNQVIGKNYSFTSEVRFPFTYTGGEVLSFVGDDDLWVWIGGRKVVDIGNPHGPANGTVTLNVGGSVSVPPSATAVPPITLTVGQTYEISVFQAERNSTGSNYKLTLAGFNRQTSQCTVPPPPTTFVRDFEAVCGPGTTPVWQLFRWKAGVPAGAQIDFRAATAPNQAALPAAPPPAAPASVPIGSATPANSPAAGPFVFVYDTLPGPVPVPVSKHLQVEGLGAVSQRWLRVYMTFNGTPTLFDWQQLFDCVPAE